MNAETIAELRRLLDCSSELPWECYRPHYASGYHSITVSDGQTVAVEADEFDAGLIVAAVNALPALLDAAALLDEVRGQVARGALCPMCSTGMTRQTVGMVCQLCGTDYARPEYASLRRDAEQTTKAALAEALAVRAERDALAAFAQGLQVATDSLRAERDALAAKVERLTGELVDAGYRQGEDRAERDALRVWQERVALAAGIGDEVEGRGVHLEADADAAAEHVAGLLAAASARTGEASA